jgi:hypothetical protein
MTPWDLERDVLSPLAGAAYTARVDCLASEREEVQA